MTHVFRIDDGETHCFVADNERDAIAQHAKLLGQTVDEYEADYGPVEVEQLDDDHLLAITFLESSEEEMNELGFKWKRNEMGEPVVEKTCREWCESSEGMISTSAY